VAEEYAGVSQRRAAGAVGCHGTQLMQPLSGAANQKQGTHTAFGGNHAAGKNTQAWSRRERCDGNQADLGRAGGQPVSALRGQHPVNLIALRKRGFERLVLKVPHQRRGIEKADGGDAQTKWLG